MVEFDQDEMIKVLNSMGCGVTEDNLTEKLDALVELGWATVEVVDGKRVYSSTKKGIMVSQHLVNTDSECAQMEKVVEGKKVH